MTVAPGSPLRIVVVGDVHAQEAKLWRMLDEAGLRDADGAAASDLHDGSTRLVLLGDLVHAKRRDVYADLANVRTFDEYDPEHLRRVEAAQEAFLRRVHAFVAPLPEDAVTILLGNHDHNAIDPDQGPLRSDDITHLEWKPDHGRPLPDDLATWLATWPREVVLDGVHFAHVGPRPEHNVFDTAFYLENRRRWIYDDRDYLAGTNYRLGVYGHTPVRGGLNLASKGRALLLDANGHADEYVWCDLDTSGDGVRVRLRGLMFDERLATGRT
ncbi:MAG: metallophosphoesterase [Trueperaceae bacterium]